MIMATVQYEFDAGMNAIAASLDKQMSTKTKNIQEQLDHLD